MSTLKYYLGKGEDFLRSKKIDKPRLEAQLLFAHRLQLQRYELYTNDHLPLQQNEIDDLRALLVRKANGEPTAYIIEKKEFFSLPLYVNSDVLIPRPESEELVEIFLHSFTATDEPPALLDMCCGSGAMGLAILSKMPNARMHFADISPDAMAVCEKNFNSLFSQTHAAEFFIGDLFAHSDLQTKKFSAIICNPPYVTQAEFDELAAEVKNFEPALALKIPHAGEKDFFNFLFRECYAHLHTGGWLYLETNPTLIDEQKKMLAELNFTEIEILKDSSHKSRFLLACR